MLKFKKEIVTNFENKKLSYYNEMTKRIIYTYKGEKIHFDIFNEDNEIYFTSYDKIGNKFLTSLSGLFFTNNEIFENRDKIHNVPFEILNDLMQERG